jgi:hypothetical protein
MPLMPIIGNDSDTPSATSVLLSERGIWEESLVFLLAGRIGWVDYLAFGSVMSFRGVRAAQHGIDSEFLDPT